MNKKLIMLLFSIFGLFPLAAMSKRIKKDLVTVQNPIPDLLKKFLQKSNNPLNRACSQNKFELVSLLIKMGIRPDARNLRDNSTPLHTATKRGYKDIISLLLTHGADVNAYISDRSHPYESVHYPQSDSTPLHTASEQGDTDIMELLIAHGADVNAYVTGNKWRPDISGFTGCCHSINTKYTPLHMATKNGHFQAVKVLLDNGAYVNAQDYDGKTAIWYAAMQGYADIVQLLINNDAEINNQNDPLSAAAKNGDVNLIKMLIKNKCDLNIRDYIGWTPLYWAANYGHDDAVKLLLASDIHLPHPNIEHLPLISLNADTANAHASSLKEARKQLIRYCCNAQLKHIKQMIPENLAILFNTHHFKTLFIAIRKAQSIDDLPADLKNMIEANIKLKLGIVTSSQSISE